VYAASRAPGIESFFFLADLHSLIKSQDPQRTQRATLEIAASWLACGLDPEHVWFYRQSDIRETTELMWFLTAIASKGILRDTRVERSGSRPASSQPLLTPEAAGALGRYLRDAVLSGTARGLRAHPWRVAGKTGTAEVTDARSHAWFVGYAPYGPAERRVAFAVIIEHAGYGSVAAAPAAGDIVSAAAANGLIR